MESPRTTVVLRHDSGLTTSSRTRPPALKEMVTTKLGKFHNSAGTWAQSAPPLPLLLVYMYLVLLWSVRVPQTTVAAGTCKMLLQCRRPWGESQHRRCPNSDYSL